MALRKVRNNLDRLFDKNLTDLIRGIRNNKENEAKYIAACIEEIKAELRQDSTYVKANAVEKLAYLQMLGYDISWASFNVIEVMASTKFNEKRIGYLAATQCFTDSTEVLMLTTNMIRKDLQSSNLYDVGVALSGLACFTTPDLARDLVNDVVNLLSSSRTYVRKKGVLLLYKIFLKYPESLRPTFSRLKDKLEDPDPGVQSAAVNVICELARKNPKNYLSLAPVFFKLMTTSSNNWMLIKIIKLFGSLVPLEGRLGKKLLEPLTNLINSTSAMSLLYECINTVIAVLISISSESPSDFLPSIQLCVQKLGVLIEDSDQNLKYLGLLAMRKILQTHPKAVQAHKDIVLRCLDDKDESIRIRALDLLYGMVSRKNIMEIVKKLMEHVDAAEGSYYRDELLARIIGICSYNNYQYITNFEWYISVLVEMTKVEGSKHGVLIAEQIQDVTVRVQSIRHFSVSQMALLVENAQPLLSGGNSAQRNNVSQVLLAAAWICGEYAEHVRNVPAVLEAMLKTFRPNIPGGLLSVYVQNIGKLYATLLTRCEHDEDWDAVESLDNLLLSKLPEFELTDHLEAQERACNLVQIVKFVESRHANRECMAPAVALLFEGELNPVASKAQKRVPIPEGLDLDAWINEPEPSTEDEDSEASEPEVAFPTMTSGQAPYTSPSESPHRNHSTKQKSTTHEPTAKDIEASRKKRQLEQENNPYYVKADSSSSKKPVTPSTPVSNVVKRSGLGFDRSESLQTAPPELQSPLEIPGVIGLERYFKQQSSTLTWKSAASGKDGGKKKSKGKKKKKRRRGGSSSEDDGADAVVVNVNRDDGEMPEGALSTGDEDDKDQNNEFKALDMDLDEPLREDEQLFAPKPYQRPEGAYAQLAATRQVDIASPPRVAAEKKKGKAKDAVIESNGKKSKKKKKTVSKKISSKNAPVTPPTSTTAPEKPRRRRKSERTNSADTYTAIDSTSTSKAPKHQATTSDSVVDRLRELESLYNESSTDAVAAAAAAVMVASQQSAGTSTMPPPAMNGFTSTGVKVKPEKLAENDDLFITGRISVSTTVDGARAISVATIKNKSEDTIRRLEVSVFETEHVKLDSSSGVTDSSSIMLPFELTAGASSDHTLHFTFSSVDSTQSLRVTLMYCVERSDGHSTEDKLNFVICFPAYRFLVYATIGATSYELVLGSDDLSSESTTKTFSPASLKTIVDRITSLSNFSVVEIHESAASLYAHSSADQPVCVLVKKIATPVSDKSKNNVTISVRSASQALTECLTQDLKAMIVNVKEDE